MWAICSRWCKRYFRVAIILSICANLQFARCCSDLYPPLNGVISGKCHGAEPQDKCSFACKSGFVLIGDPTVTCLKHNSWDNLAPVCTKVITNSDAALFCVRVLAPSNGFVTGKCGGPHSGEGDSCTFYCNKGFSLVGEKTLQCQSNGQWTSDTPKCISAALRSSSSNQETTGNAPDNSQKCPDIEIPENVQRMRTNEENVADTVIYFSCLPGLKLVGKNSIKCQESGEWTSTVPMCKELVKCKEMGAPQFGVIFGKVQNSREGDVIFFSCDVHYRLVGKGSLVCEANGQWSGSTPRCNSESEHDKPFKMTTRPPRK